MVMSERDHYKKLENIYYAAELNMMLNPSISISKGKCELDTEFGAHCFHAAAAAHGALIFKTLDDSAYFAANSLILDYFLVTVSYNVHFVRPVFSEKIHSIGSVVEQTKNQIIAESTSYNSKNKKVAFGVGVFMKSHTKLNDLKYYKL